MTKALFVDHFDSFSNNLVAALQVQGIDVTLVESQALEGNNAALSNLCENHDALIFSPGPGKPSDYPQSLRLAKLCPTNKPLLGVCLGLQIVLQASGRIVRQTGPRPIHGRQETVRLLQPSRLLAESEIPTLCVFYNSLGVPANEGDLLQSEWSTLAVTADGMVALAEHKQAPHLLAQFHPESFATPNGMEFLVAFARLVRRHAKGS